MEFSSTAAFLGPLFPWYFGPCFVMRDAAAGVDLRLHWMYEGKDLPAFSLQVM